MKDRTKSLIVSFVLLAVLIAVVYYSSLPNTIAVEGTPVYIEHPTEKYNCWAIYSEETYYFIMIDENYILDYKYLSNCDHITIEGSLEIIDSLYILHADKLTKS